MKRCLACLALVLVGHLLTSESFGRGPMAGHLRLGKKGIEFVQPGGVTNPAYYDSAGDIFALLSQPVLGNEFSDPTCLSKGIKAHPDLSNHLAVGRKIGAILVSIDSSKLADAPASNSTFDAEVRFSGPGCEVWGAKICAFTISCPSMQTHKDYDR